MQKIKESLEKILKLTTEIYIEEMEPVSSSHLLNKHNLDCSSAKIRYLMNELETKGFLEKAHISSGRIPSVKGLQYYSEYLALSQQEIFTKKLKKVFAKRKLDITDTLEQAAELISDVTGLTLITSRDDSNELLKSIQLVPISNYSASIILILSNGSVFSKILNIKNYHYKLEDIRIAIRLFKEKLVNTKITELSQRAELLKPLLAKSVSNYEELLENFSSQVFNFAFKKQNKVYGKNNIILSEGINRQDLNRMLDLIENHSIWEIIEGKTPEDQNLKISIDKSGSIMSKRLPFDGSIQEISVVTSTVSDFAKMRSAILFLEDLVTKKNGNVNHEISDEDFQGFFSVNINDEDDEY
ncbi:heat-inducible transcriptional repressor HrcA [Mycoplasmopsis alligatoris]|uniref:Heat-inducible transcription repressor HrcA n=1 Tax=Mycoplasmopsis alligatoris A21JP2 TaxID=747682 RepID=D4XW68_9BACT|nr:heat-inducible transcriptional repressor HrcA [Mycoplasmopsis alligatoris]EFF41419.1 heat-inducible transcription repressor HrcA [Mycoplasmopsis alligatoris A21JP2]